MLQATGPKACFTPTKQVRNDWLLTKKREERRKKKEERRKKKEERKKKKEDDLTCLLEIQATQITGTTNRVEVPT